jgi:putative endonuclease
LRKTVFASNVVDVEVDDVDSGRAAMKRTRFLGRKNPSPGSESHFVYMVRCSDGSLYTGYTTDPLRRLAEHNSGRASRYTRSRRPVTLVYLEELTKKGEALSRERLIKRMKKEEKLLLCRTSSGREKPSWR